MSSKTVKITNGKILNYTITASGYQTVTGSKIITGNDTININLVAEGSGSGAYSFGDRLANLATFVDYFNATNPDTNVDTTYAVFVLDAQYRVGGKVWANNNYGNLPIYSTSTDGLAAKESATYNTTSMLSTYSLTDVLAFASARNAATITFGNQTFSSQLPNLAELKMIYDNKAALDALDPTVSTYSSNSLTTWNIGGNSYNTAWSSTMMSSGTAQNVRYDGGISNGSTGKTNPFGVIPVLEIPVN